MRQDIVFDAEGVTLRGWLYLPDRAAGPVPTVVMAHGFSAVKEMFLDSFAEAFAAGGLGALVFDNRNFGASDGEPRQEIDPWAQVRDYRHAITYAQTRPEVDPDGIGVWGSSYSGGHVLVLGAIDKRIRCVACQVPLVSGMGNIQRLVRQDFLAPNRVLLEQDRAGLEERGHAAHRRDADGVRTRHLHRTHQPHAAADGRGRRRPPDPDRSRPGGLPAGARAEEAGAAPGRPLRRLREGLRRGQRRGPRLVPRASGHAGVGLLSSLPWQGTVRLEEVGPGWRWQMSLPTSRRRSWRVGSGGASCRRSRSWTPSSSGSRLETRA